MDNSTSIDVVISGEQQEADGVFDSPEYVLDAAAIGVPKGWIMLGHAVSEDAGVLEMAQWIKRFVPEVPVELVKAGEPFWAPDWRVTRVPGCSRRPWKRYRVASVAASNR